MLYTAAFSLLGLVCILGLVATPASAAPAVPGYAYGLAGAALALGGRLILEQIQLARLRRGILLAREGLLEAVPTRHLGATGAGRVSAEYNATMVALQTMFRSVEECQGRFLNQRNKMNTMLQSLPGALLSISDDLQVVVANKLAEEMFAGQGVPLIGRNLFDLLRVSERDREMLRDAFLYKQPIQSQEITLGNAAGPRYFSLNLGFYSDADNDMAGVLILQDISEYRRLQDSVAKREKLVAMGQLAAGVAHELNTPLGSILGYAQLLGRVNGDAEKRAEYARIIAEETKRCSRIVQDLLNYARDDRCSGETCEVNQLLRDLTETFLNCRMKRYQIAIHLDLSPEPVIVEGGCGQLDIVFTNLINNAIQALDGVAEPRIVVTSRREADQALIAVADNGPGVPNEARSRIFDPFFTTKEVGQGSGLGLPICQALLNKRGGFVDYDAEYAGGARFVVTLPAVDTRRAGL
jgi:signal transduction histidine kinase